MVVKCQEQDYQEIMKYLQKEPIYNTFIISDIQIHRFQNDYQVVYMQLNKKNECCGVFLKYYNNLIIAGEEAELDYEQVICLITDNITTIMGKYNIICRVSERLAGKSVCENKNLYYLKEDSKLLVNQMCRKVNSEDVTRVHRFLMSIPQFQSLYAEKDMIYNRIKNKEGIHMIIEKEGEIIAHANSAASTDKTCMIGGVCVKEEYRRKGYAKKVLSEVSRKILRANKMPCIFADANKNYTIFEELGFVYYGKWGVIQMGKENENEK